MSLVDKHYSTDLGQHYLANQDIQVGELIISDQPYIYAGPNSLHTLNTLVTQLYHSEHFNQLHYIKHHKSLTSKIEYISDEDWNKALNIIITNNFHSRGRSYLFPKLSYFNHSCVPNAMLINNEKTQKGYIYAIKPIGRGEEVTISYIASNDPLDKNRHHRQKKLDRWQFICKCPACLDNNNMQLINYTQEMNKIKPTYESVTEISSNSKNFYFGLSQFDKILVIIYFLMFIIMMYFYL